MTAYDYRTNRTGPTSPSPNPPLRKSGLAVLVNAQRYSSRVLNERPAYIAVFRFSTFANY